MSQCLPHGKWPWEAHAVRADALVAVLLVRIAFGAEKNRQLIVSGDSKADAGESGVLCASFPHVHRTGRESLG